MILQLSSRDCSALDNLFFMVLDFFDFTYIGGAWSICTIFSILINYPVSAELDRTLAGYSIGKREGRLYSMSGHKNSGDWHNSIPKGFRQNGKTLYYIVPRVLLVRRKTPIVAEFLSSPITSSLILSSPVPSSSCSRQLFF